MHISFFRGYQLINTLSKTSKKLHHLYIYFKIGKNLIIIIEAAWQKNPNFL